jgi:hypothetical protein
MAPRIWPLPLSSTPGIWPIPSQTAAPMKVAKGKRRLPWNKRTPSQIMPQARKVNAPGTTEGNVMIESGMLASAMAAAPIR